MYRETPKYKLPETYNYVLPALMVGHIDNWILYLKDMKKESYDVYGEAKDEAYDMTLADKFVCMNKVIGNEILYLSRFRRRIDGLPESDLLYVNKELHDYFHEHSDVKDLDFSI